jgi:hypothetical protein
MAIAVTTILTWCRLSTAAKRAAVTEALMPDDLSDLAGFSTDEIKEASKTFPRLPANPFLLSPHTTKRLTQLTLWVKDQVRLDAVVEFPDATDQDEFIAQIETAQRRHKIRTERQKGAETLANVRIDPALKSSIGWEAWIVAVRTALTIAYGSKGVPLLYVIRQDAIPDLTPRATWEELAIHAAPHQGLDYESDRMTVHLFLLNNIGEDSDAYTYIQPLLTRNDGRRDITALIARYENDATIQTRVNEANKTWEMLVYKNERAMSFESFCQKIQKALQHFDRAARPKHEGDVIDWIWNHIQNAELNQTVSALKAAQGLTPRTPTQILQELAKEIPNLVQASSFKQRVSGVHTGSSDFTFDGDTPTHGAHTTEGKLFCGSYSHSRWFSDDMTQYRDEIKELREKHQPEYGSGRRKQSDVKQGDGHPKRKNQVKKHQLKVKELKKQNEELQLKLSELKRTDQESKPGSNAGESFGGRDSMKPH